MTDTPPPSTESEDDDLLASLYLDGEATEEERARVEASPELMARVRAFAALAQQLPAVAPPEGLRESQIANALAVFDQQVASTQAPSVTSLDAKRLERRSAGVPTWLGAAAALALVVGGIGFVASGGLGGSNDEAATADVATDTAESLSPSGASRLTTTTGAEESMANDAMDDEAMEEQASTEMAEAEMASDDAGDSDEGADAAAEEAEDVAADEAGPAPIELDQFSATTAAGFYEFVVDAPRLPVEASLCADSPLVQGLFGVDSFLPVVFEGELASFLFRDGDPSTAVIVGPTCEIILE